MPDMPASLTVQNPGTDNSLLLDTLPDSCLSYVPGNRKLIRQPTIIKTLCQLRHNQRKRLETALTRGIVKVLPTRAGHELGHTLRAFSAQFAKPGNWTAWSPR